jgi:UDP-2,3-diacylglucosamine pyrophosphatase LpxH
MAIASEEIILGTLPLQYPRAAQNVWRALAHRRLTEVFEMASEVLFDDSCRIVFFSDCHRGDNSRADAFARNEQIFLRALTYYEQEGFTYIEVGDGDELWKNRRFGDVRKAHGCIFDLLHRFDQQNRLHLIVGNHDIQRGRRDQVEKDGMIAREGLILRHARTGQRIFVVHGHQADFKSDCLYIMSRFVVRYVWKRLQLLDFAGVMSHVGHSWKQGKIEQTIIGWIQAHWQIVICGHTHRPMFAAHGAPPYFNTGSCVSPGYITGLEIQNGEIVPVKWSAWSDVGQGGSLRIEREPLASPKKLRSFG